ncbi:MAG: tetratricopeptide repeat protein [Burkholderiaceae bacterium]|nr:MAG: tetratricopeptide repeat protein [Burkholderiaceae bacterium]
MRALLTRARRMKKTGRNDPCPCGSGKKFKQCCQVRQAGAAAPASSAAAEAMAAFSRGLSLQGQGQLAAAAECYAQAVACKPDFPEALCNLALVLQWQGLLDQAVEHYRAALRIKPDFPEAHFNLGVVLQAQEQIEPAVQQYRRALTLKPDFPEALCNLGQVLQAQGEADDALTLLRRAVQLRPSFPEGHFNLGVTLRAQGELAAAIAHYQQAIALRPDYAEAHNNLGNALEQQGQHTAAVESLRRALALKPDYAEAHFNLGVALQSQGQVDAAMAAYRQALVHKQYMADAHKNLGNALKDLGQLEQAEESYRKTLALAPDDPEAHNNLALALQEQGQLDEAIASLRQALTLKPDYIKAHSNLLFTLNYHPDLSAEEIYAEYRRWDGVHTRPFLPSPSSPALLPLADAAGEGGQPQKRLRIGYVSPDFRRHSARHFIEPILAHHDKTQVEVFAYSEVAVEDEVTQRCKAQVDHWCRTTGMSDDALAEKIRADGIDILVDLAGHTMNNRLGVLARRPAPIQASHWLGYGCTTGVAAIDYFIADALLAPPGAEHLFAETPLRLPALIAYRPADNMGDPGPLPAARNGHITFGALTRSVRINHRVVAAWSEILKRMPTARLLINSGNFRCQRMQTRLLAQFAAQGIDTARLSLGFESPPWDVLRKIDITLDCFPHNSGTTLFESLYLGVPFITLAGRPSVGRIGSSIVHHCGHPEWIAHSEAEYIEKNVALASDIDKLAQIRQQLRPQMQASPLQDEAGYVRNLEQAYRTIWENWCQQPAEKEIEKTAVEKTAVEKPAIETPAVHPPGRNDPCLCGSGKKYKQCCLPNDQAQQQAQARQQHASAAAARAQHSMATQTLQEALTHHRAGRLPQAEALYRQILERVPDHADALHLLGVLAHQMGDHARAVATIDQAIRHAPAAAMYCNRGLALQALGQMDAAADSFQQALQLQPGNLETHNNLGLTLHAQGKFTAAAQHFRKALAGRPDYAEAHSNLSSTLQALGQAKEAEQYARKAIAFNPRLAEAHSNLGNALQAQKLWPAAVAAYQQALTLQPDFVRAHYNLGAALSAQGDLDGALQSYRRALAIAPDDAACHNNLGLTLYAKEEFDAALDHYRRALQMRPGYAEAHNNLGLALQRKGDLETAQTHYRQAILHKPQLVEAHDNLGNVLKKLGRAQEAAASYRRVLELDPKSADAHYNLGNVMLSLGDLNEAAACFQRAIALRPDYAVAHNDLGIVYKEQGNLDAAIASYQQAIAAQPEYVEAYSNLALALQAQCRLDEAIASLRRALALRPDFADAHSNLLFCLNYHPDLSGEEIFAEYRRWNIAHAQPPSSPALLPPADAAGEGSKRRLRIGYMSGDFRQHSARFFIEPLLAAHDKTQMEVFAYAEVGREDAFTSRCKNYVDHWRSTVGLNDATVAQQIRLDGIDILVDLAGHTGGNRLRVFAHRPAPIQIESWMGLACTSGMTAADYFLSDAHMAPPGSEALFSERLLRMPWLTAYRPAGNMGEPGPLPALSQGQITFGALTRSVRINHRVISAWAEILRRVPQSRLVFNSENFRCPTLCRNITAQFVERDIAAERVQCGFESPPWDVLRKIDITLDCFPHNSGTTLFESLYMGVPFVTLANRPGVGRLGASILNALGRPEWVAQDEARYVRIAAELANDISALANVRAGLRTHMEASPLRDEAGYARALEAEYRRLWQAHCAAAGAAALVSAS